MKLLSLFSGIGAFEKALPNIKIVNYCEIDKYASASYSAIHDISEDLNLWDVTKIDTDLLPDFDMVTFGFPCQDLSVAGKQAGMSEGTRSNLYWEAHRIIEAKRPRIIMFENVKNLVSKKFRKDFDAIVTGLEELGYSIYWKVLNAKDYGIPQNRERVFCIGVLGEREPIKWPEPFDNGLRLKDLLEDEVDEKYYISDEKCQKLLESLKDEGSKVAVPCLTPDRVEKRQNGEPMFTLTGQDRHGVLQVGEFSKEDINDNERQRRVYSDEGCSPSVLARTDSPKVLQVGNIEGKNYNQNKVVYSVDGISPTIHGQGHCGNEPKVLQVGNIAEEKNFSNPQTGRVYSPDGCSPTLNTCGGGQREPKVLMHTAKQIVRVRKHEVDIEGLKKCLRYYKQLANISNKQLAERLETKQTLVEHWFRNDNCFSIPEADIWYRLKDLLQIKTDKFDVSITEFEEREGVFEQGERYYDANGLSPTITTGNEHRVLTHSPYVDKKYAEFITENGYLPELFNPYNKTELKDYAPTLTAQGDSVTKSGTVLKAESFYRIRKLTPLETWRLMDFSDEDFYKAKERLNKQFYKGKDKSNSQLYKQAGNSIVVAVLKAIVEANPKVFSN